MYLFRVFIIFNFSLLVKCERFFSAHNDERSPRVIDAYNGFDDTEESSNIYQYKKEPSWLTKYQSHKNSPTSLEESQKIVYRDTLNFQYPKIEFLTDNEDTDKTDNDRYQDFIFLHPNGNTNILSNDENKNNNHTRRYRVHKLKRPQQGRRPYKISHIQRVYKPNSTISTTTTANRYEEADLASNSLEISSNNTKFNNQLNKVNNNDTTSNTIDQFLKNYLMKLYSKKYNTPEPTSTSIKPNSYSKIHSENNLNTQQPETKFFDNVVSNIQISKNKILSLFTIVQFNNTQCNATGASGSYQGVCYTAAECTDMMGMALGDCADGYGVCCVALGSCGDSSSQNCSYFQSPNYPDYYPSDAGVIIPTTQAPPVSPTPPTPTPPATTANPSPTPDPRYTWFYYRGEDDRARQTMDSTSCIFSVNKASEDISKIRIDFLDLELASPTNGTCVTERLVIYGQNVNTQIPQICGYNTGQHVYVDVSTLSGPLQIAVLSTITYRKRFSIRICQYSDSCLEPASDCLQYYTGVTGSISSFNYDQIFMFNRSVPGYINNLNYAICIRREAGYCSITYTNVRNGVEYPFQLINVLPNGTSIVPAGQSGVGSAQCPNDYIVIGGMRLCGAKFNDRTINTNASVNALVTDTNAGPIVIPVRTNNAVSAVGFRLFYTQNRCNMNQQ